MRRHAVSRVILPEMSQTSYPVSWRERVRFPHDLIDRFFREWEIIEMALFGSVLDGRFTEDSDVDVLVTLRPNTRRGLLEWVAMTEQLSDILGRKVDLIDRRGVERSRNPRLRRHIIESAEVVHVAG